MPKQDPAPPEGDEAKHRVALAVAVHTVAALQELVSCEHPKLTQSHSEAFKLLARLTKAKSGLAFLATKKGTV